MKHQLQIRHIGEHEGKPQFVVSRLGDGKSSSPVTLTPPNEIIVEGRPKSHLQEDLRWYLEDFLKLPSGGNLSMADRIQQALQTWGSDCFNSLFQGNARDWFQDARRDGLQLLTLKISSDDPRILSLPWEALHNPQIGALAHHCRIERQLNQGYDPLPLPDNLSQDCINILLVIARPRGDKDVGFHALSRPMVELTKASNFPIHIEVLRPPTFDQLQQKLHEKPGFYHIVHFDGHGGYGTQGAVSPDTFKGMQGMLIFEDEQTKPSAVEAERLSTLMAEHRIPIMVLNACQSATIDEHAEDAFASVATALLKAGVRSVVAMGYSLYVSGAQKFVPAFYQRLLDSSNVAEAVLAGRQAMYSHPQRDCMFGEHELQDWLVPVLYQQSLPDEEVLPLIKSVSDLVFPKPNDSQTALPEIVQQLGDYGFIGRQNSIQALERARLQQPQAGLLIHGMAGIGKSTLTKGFLHWLHDTHGLAEELPNRGLFWFSFNEIRSAESIINQLISALFGIQACAEPLQQKMQALSQALKDYPFLLIWDNFESACGISGTEVNALLSKADQDLLKDLLKRLRGGKTKVLITSRSPENWLSLQECYRLPLSGLQGEELWQYCNAVVQDLNLKLDRTQADYQELIEQLDGHPLAIRAILLRLPERSASELLTELKHQFTGLASDDSTRHISAALSLFDQGLPEHYAPVLQLIGLHERYVDQYALQIMLGETEDQTLSTQISDCLNTLETAGLLHALGQDRNNKQNIYRMHPALRSHLNDCHIASEEMQQRFVDFMGSFAEALAPKEEYEQRVPFALHSSNFHNARVLAKKLNMQPYVAALTQSLATYALNTRNFVEASHLFEDQAEHAKQSNNYEIEAAAYHQLGRIAQEQRDFTTAENWYLKALEIFEKQGNEHGAAGIYHQLGRIAEEQRDFKIAENWYLKSLQINEKQGNQHRAAMTYHQLGNIAQEQRDFTTAENWYLKALEIFEKQGNEHGAAMTYHQLGSIAEEQRDFTTAEKWYLKSLQINEKQGDEHGAASAYHQLGRIAQEQRDFTTAEKWYLKALEINEKQGNEHGAANTYHQLGIIAQEQRDFKTAEKWYLKSLEIKEKQGNQHGAATTYHQLGSIAQEQRDFKTAEKWYLKALEINEKQGNEHHASFTYGQLGLLHSNMQQCTVAGQWLLKSLLQLIQTNDPHTTGQVAKAYWDNLQAADLVTQTTLRQNWREAGLDDKLITLEELEQLIQKSNDES